MYNVIIFDELDSTNTYCKTNYLSLNNNDVVVADLQTLGRGRMSRNWHATNDSLTFSIVFKDKKIIDDFSSLSLISSVAVYNTLKKYIDNIYLKWPNDVIVNNKKICGILMESISHETIDCLILGIGININNDSFPKELNATSLFIESNKKIDKIQILNELLVELDKLLKENLNGNKEYLETFKKHNYLLGKKVFASINNELVEVIVKDILDDNRILVSLNNKELALSTGELTFHKESNLN